jgi:hypothetical protein
MRRRKRRRRFDLIAIRFVLFPSSIQRIRSALLFKLLAI